VAATDHTPDEPRLPAIGAGGRDLAEERLQLSRKSIDVEMPFRVTELTADRDVEILGELSRQFALQPLQRC
jgi:hypothetical protein